ncbi:hypothetical protein KI427_16695 [Rhodococcus ruber]|uniref:hypothetical protein n=1 Tax=Rhodococcus ruber TaxID=1830 RepID=UPI000743699F|nr:hypothetical protein [Rhodococcus ruber]UQB71256.1 hypothetical protein KI427_16695 [Rhodococcus ruber]
MPRNRASAKSAGRKFEQLVAAYLATHVDDGIERRRLNGSKDRGDITGLKVHGLRAVVECKDYGGRYEIKPWLDEADTARVNDDADIALVAAKRRGTTEPGDQVVFMTLRDLVALIIGHRPPLS